MAVVKKSDPRSEAIGQSTGGCTTKIHAVTDGAGRLVVEMLTPGNDHDVTVALDLLYRAIGFNTITHKQSHSKIPTAILGDRAYDSQRVLDAFSAAGIRMGDSTSTQSSQEASI